MSAEVKKELHLEIAHVLFMDMVGYSKLLVNEQREIMHQLNQIVRKTAQFQTSEANGKLISIPSGDGMALVFFQSLEEPVQCALEISKALKNYPQIRLRMGVHSGPVDQVMDVNDRINVAGAGINVAERVMDCGDAGHILVSKRVAEDLAQDSLWQPHLHELGQIEVKHGEKLGIVNLYTAELGNPQPPEKLSHIAAAPKFPGVPFAQKSIAVLAFVNMSNDPDNEYFSDGIAEEIINTLTKVKALRVVSRTSSFSFKGRSDDIGEIGRKLKVNTVLEGSVRKASDKLRVTAQLINVADGYHLWSERYDRQLEDVFEIQDQIAENIVRALRVVLGEDENAQLRRRLPRMSKPTSITCAVVSSFISFAAPACSMRVACSIGLSKSIRTSRWRTQASPTAARFSTCTGTAARRISKARMHQVGRHYSSIQKVPRRTPRARSP